MNCIYPTQADDLGGHYAWPDVFNLSVNTKSKSAVAFEGMTALAAGKGGKIEAAAAGAEGKQSCSV